MLFAFTITPKRILHNLVANHKDGRANASLPDANTTNLTKASFNCQCDNPITESPFVSINPSPGISCRTPFAIYLNRYVHLHYTSDLIFFGLRGPPVSPA